MIFANPSHNFSTTSGSKLITIKHIPIQVNPSHMYDLLRVYGRLISCKVLMDRNGREQYAVIQYEFQDAAETAMEKMQNAILKGSKL